VLRPAQHERVCFEIFQHRPTTPRPALPPPVKLSFTDRLTAWLISWAGWLILQVIGKTARFTVRAPAAVQALWRDRQPIVYAFWHRYQLLLAYVHRGQGVCVLVSRSKDGELIARPLERLGYNTARGSSTRGGASALRELLRHLEEGHSVAFTPDGPRGPLDSVQPGVVAAAQTSGRPVVPVVWAGGPAKALRSWDRFLIPLPFGRFHVVYGEPLRLAPDETDGEEKIRRALNETVRRAEEAAGPGSASAPSPGV